MTEKSAVTPSAMSVQIKKKAPLDLASVPPTPAPLVLYCASRVPDDALRLTVGFTPDQVHACQMISVHARPWKVPLAFGKARLTDRRAGRRCLFCGEECKQRDSNYAKDHNVLGAILPVHPVRRGLRRHDCHREPMGKA
jgi:hypothetical protein